MKLNWEKIFIPVNRWQTITLIFFSIIYGALFVNYIEYSIFSMALIDATVPPLYHGWLEVLYIVPFIAIPVLRGPFSIVFVYVLGRIASIANDFVYPLYAKFVFNAYDGSILEWWVWILGFGPGDEFSWIVKMPFVTYQMTSTIMGINLLARILIIAGFFYIAYLIHKKALQ